MWKLAAAMSAVFVVVFAAGQSGAGERLGVILMHGKGGTPMARSLRELTEELESEGHLVSVPDMPWSRRRGFDKTYEDAMKEIDGVVAALRKQGATRIVVGGHSLGANAAIGYGARRDGIAGILAIAPGHVPVLWARRGFFDDSLKKAKAMVASGKADTTADFDDINQGEKFTVTITARIYLSWWDPEGPAVMPRNAAGLRKGTALLWIIGERDRMFKRGKNYGYVKAPPHPRSAYVVVRGGHRATPRIGATEITLWLRKL